MTKRKFEKLSDEESTLAKRVKKNSYKFTEDQLSRIIVIDHSLDAEKQKILSDLLSSFPHANKHSDWPRKFPKINFQEYPEDLLSIAANAIDDHGNTMLGVACEYGADLKAIQTLIDIGADLNAKDRKQNTALHWSTYNKLSCKYKTSFDAVLATKCVLVNGAKTEIKNKNNQTPVEWAKIFKQTAAIEMIEVHIKQKNIAANKGAGAGMFHNLSQDVGSLIGSFFQEDEWRTFRKVNKKADELSKKEVNAFYKTQKLDFFKKVGIEIPVEDNTFVSEVDSCLTL